MIVATDVLIWYFRGYADAKAFLAGISHENRAITSLSIMELAQGCLDRKELKIVKDFVKENISKIVHPDERISEKALLLLERHSLSDGLRTVDALIAASALLNNASLATANFRHFKKIPSLALMKFEPAGK